MGGWHIAHRATNYSKYIGIASTLKLPTSCGFEPDSNPGADIYDGVKPEFFHGFYKSGYGFDVGVVYRDYEFKIFYSGPVGTVPGEYDQVSLSGVSNGNTIELKTYLSGSKIVAEVWKGTTKINTLNVPLSSGAASAFATGAKLNRELTIASNRPDYIPCDAYFSDTTFSRTTLTTTSYSYEKLRLSNSTLTRYADEGTMDGNRYGYLTPTEDSEGYVIDTGSCDFR